MRKEAGGWKREVLEVKAIVMPQLYEWIISVLSFDEEGSWRLEEGSTRD